MTGSKILTRAMAGAVALSLLGAGAAQAADTTAPTITLSVAPATGVTGPFGASKYFSGNVKVQYTAVDGGQGQKSGIKSINCTSTGGSLTINVPAGNGGQQPNSVSDYILAGGEADWTVTCTATDDAGNTSTSKTVNFRIDTTAPIPAAAVTNSTPTSVTVSLSAADPVIAATPASSAAPGSGVKEILYSIDGGAEQSTTSNPKTITFTGAGSHTIVYRARDNVGNTSATKTITVQVDSTKPDVFYNGAASRTVVRGDGGSDAGPTILSGTATDNVGVKNVSVRIYSAGDSDVGFDRTYAASCPSCSPSATFVSWSLNLTTLSPAPPPGVYSTEIIARDQAGNVRRTPGPTLTFT